MYYKIFTDSNWVPRLKTSEYNPNDYGDYEWFESKDEAKEHYILGVRSNRKDFLRRINRNMTRVASCDRKIRMAESL